MRALSVFVSLLLLMSCKSSQLQDVTPALLSPSADAARREIQVLIGDALGGNVLLSDDAFTRNSQLVIERRPQRDPAGNRLPGRVLEEPGRFRLALRGGECILLHVNSGRHWVLNQAACVPAPADQHH